MTLLQGRRRDMVAVAISIAAIVALFYAFTLGSSPCARADASCGVGDNEVFAGTVGIQSGTAFTHTLSGAPTADRTLTLQDSADTLVGRATTDTLTNKTLTGPVLTSPVLNTGVSGTAVLDEDDLASDSATQIATQQSIKAYVDVQAGAPIIALKTAAEVVNNSTALQNDDHLVLAVEANTEYAFELLILGTFLSATPGIDWKVTVPAAASATGMRSTATSPLVFTNERTENPAGAVDQNYYYIGSVITGGNAGNVQLQWAQNVATSENTTFRAGSWMRLDAN